MQVVRGSIQFEKVRTEFPLRPSISQAALWSGSPFSPYLYGAECNASCLSPVRNCPGGSFCLVSVRFRAERTAAGGRDQAAVGRRGGSPRGCAEPRHPHRAPESGDSGSRRRAVARRVGAVVVDQPQPDVDRVGADEPVRRRPEPDQRHTPRGLAGRHPGAADRRRLHGELEQFTALVEQLLPDLQSAAALESVGRLHAAAAPQLQDRQHPAAARDQPQDPRERRHDAAADHRADRAQREKRVLGPGVLDQQPQRAAPVAGSGQAAAGRQRKARADRHDGAHRHRRGAIGSREKRRIGDRRRSGDQVGGRSAADAHLRSGAAGFLDRSRSSRATTRRFRFR